MAGRMLRDVASAIRLLTVLPLGTREGEHAARYFALVGWLFAAVALGIASGAVALGAADGLKAVLTATVIVAAWAVLAGFLHWDGLADSADGLGVRGDAQRRLAVMRDSTIGAFGVAAVVFVAIAQVAAVAVIVESRSWWALAAAPVLGRWGAGVALSLREPARIDGLGARYARRTSALDLAVQTVPVVALIAAPGGQRATIMLAVVLGIAAAWVIPAPFARRLGGITGDVLGATVLLTEAVVLVMGALAGGPL